MRGYRTRVDEQARIIEEYKARLEDHDKKFDESARKLTTILQVGLPTRLTDDVGS